MGYGETEFIKKIKRRLLQDPKIFTSSKIDGFKKFVQTKQSMARKNEELELDFENFSVEAPRASTIRDAVQSLKSSTWVQDLRLLTHELGVEQQASDDLFGSSSAKVFSTSPGNQEITLTSTNSDLFVTQAGKAVLEVHFLPKSNDFAVAFVDEEWMTSANDTIQQLKPLIEQSKKKKSDRSDFIKSKTTKV